MDGGTFSKLGWGGGRTEETLLLVSLYFFGKIGGEAKVPQLPPPGSAVPGEVL